MGRVFVVGAHVPNGGTYMAYHVGRIVAERFGLSPVALRVRKERAADSSFDYPLAFDELAIDDLLDVARPADLLVSSPSFSDHQLGARFPGTSIMYVQGANTYKVIDGFFDDYVAVSPFVRDHLELHYGWRPPVIPPFVAAVPTDPPAWEDRPEGSVLVSHKLLGSELLALLRRRLDEGHPDAALRFTVLDRVPRPTALAAMRGHRYFLTLSPLEGHPLMPLEAMLCGCCVVGFHGQGGTAYLRSGENSAVVGYPRIDAVARLLADLQMQPQRAAGLARRGLRDAAAFDRASFEQRWIGHLDEVMAGRR